MGQTCKKREDPVYHKNTQLFLCRKPPYNKKSIKQHIQRERHTKIMFAWALYTDLRPNEDKTAYIENGFIVANNSK